MELLRNLLSHRRPTKRTTRVSCLKGSFGLGRNLALSVHDLSEIGARLVLREALAIREEVEVILEGVQLNKSVKLSARIVWCVAVADGTFSAGMRFEKGIPFSALQALVNS